MTNEFYLLLITAVSLGFFHTITGPDHYLPFIAISRTRKWSMSKTLLFTTLCGIGHVGSSVILGIIGISFGIAVSQLEFLEGLRGSIITWIFTAFGFLYLVWGIWRAIRKIRHSHFHTHSDGSSHSHLHSHSTHEHYHAHESKKSGKITPWILFTIFVFGPCEPLIPVVMYPSAQGNITQLIIVTLVFMATTLATMLSVVYLTTKGIKLFQFKNADQYSHAIAGGTIFICGLGMLFFGL